VSQGYIHYNTSALAMFARQDYLGEDNISLALADFANAYAFE